ncbi:MAG: hypothetical protein LBP83_05940 [Dysgonamonadaceae bacterium]|jgi:hypothetical protein|nr:hypothetical protein [Dysgonamonadaceae bacterium]
MENEKTTYENWIERIRTASPVLDHPDALTQTVLKKIEETTVNKPKSRFLYFTGLISNVAAVLMLCVLIYETIYPQTFSSKEKGTSRLLSVSMTSGLYQEVVDFEKDKKITGQKKVLTVVIRKKMEAKARKEQLYMLTQKINH